MIDSSGGVNKKLFPLIAYPDPSSCPISHYLSQAQRDDVAESMNTAILRLLFLFYALHASVLLTWVDSVSQAAHYDKSLERVVQHLTLLHEEYRIKEKMK